MGISALTWAVTENFCNKYLIFGHTVWHIGMANGLDNFINFIIKLINTEDTFETWDIV